MNKRRPSSNAFVIGEPGEGAKGDTRGTGKTNRLSRRMRYPIAWLGNLERSRRRCRGCRRTGRERSSIAKAPYKPDPHCSKGRRVQSIYIGVFRVINSAKKEQRRGGYVFAAAVAKVPSKLRPLRITLCGSRQLHTIACSIFLKFLTQ